MPPSITTWTRLEPRPRAPSLTGTLDARVRDPLWMLTRQWQLGEFHGEDAGSPAWAQVTASISDFTGWTADGKTIQAWTSADPLEDLVEAESFAPDVALRVELGQLFQRLLGASVPATVRTALARAYALPPRPATIVPVLDAILAGAPQKSRSAPLMKLGKTQPTTLKAGKVTTTVVTAFADGGVVLSKDTTIAVLRPKLRWTIADPHYDRVYAAVWSAADKQIWVYLDGVADAVGDNDAMRMRDVCAGRAVDGFSLYVAAKAKLALLPGKVLGATANATALNNAAQAFVVRVNGIYGEIGVRDPSAWRPERLEYSLFALATSPDGGTATLAADPGRSGAFDWYTFDRWATKAGTTKVQTTRFSIVPGHVRFRGMPNARWWDFEAGTTPVGDILPDKRDVAKLVLMDFMLVHGNDWFAVPLDQPLGTLCRIDALVVRDVFGIETLVERADTAPAAPSDLWTLFSTAVVGKDDEVADFFLLPPSAGTAAQAGPAVEEVRFLRDEGANMVWGVEVTTENGVGDPWPGFERDQARKAARGEPAPVTTQAGNQPPPPLRYLIQTPVPESWIPFLPVADGAKPGKFWLERTFMQSAAGGAVLPLGRILRPTSLKTSDPYRVFEEEVPCEGTSVSRQVVRTRWIDGSTHLWIARRRGVGTGEGSSGLRFDLAVPAGRTPDEA